MIKKNKQFNKRLSGKNSSDSGINESWSQDNQAWWDWYVTLADNSQQLKPSVVDLPDLDDSNLPSDEEIEAELSKPYRITKIQCDDFLNNGFIKLPNVLSRGAVARLRYELKIMLNDEFNKIRKENRANRFLSLEMMWLKNPIIKKYVLSSRIGKICANLLNVESVRLYHDNVLAKEPGCGRTPWHFDDHHFPLATNKVVTAWIPAQAIPLEMGPLAFAKPLNVYDLVKHIEFNKFDTSYDKKISQTFESNNISIEKSSFEIGEISFHHNLCFHTADGNNTNRSRIVLANTFYEDGARVVNEPSMVTGDWKKFIPGVAPGEIASSELNPICWSSKKGSKT